MGSLRGTPMVPPTLLGALDSHPNKPLWRQQPTRAWCRKWGRGRGCTPTLLPQPQEWRGQGALPTVPEAVMSPSLGSGGKGGPGAAQGQCWPLGCTLSQNLGRKRGGHCGGARVGGDQSFNWVRGRDPVVVPGVLLGKPCCRRHHLSPNFCSCPSLCQDTPAQGTAGIGGLPVPSKHLAPLGLWWKEFGPPEDLPAYPPPQ